MARDLVCGDEDCECKVRRRREIRILGIGKRHVVAVDVKTSLSTAHGGRQVHVLSKVVHARKGNSDG